LTSESAPLPEPLGGDVTLLLTDIETSTQLLEALGEDYPRVIVRSRQLLEKAIARHGGVVVDSQGDAFFAAFKHAGSGVHAAVDIQRSFALETWPSAASVRVRIGLHTGRPTLVDGKYFGLDVHRAARIAAAAAGGHVLLSAATRAQLHDDDVPIGVDIRDVGSHRLKDIRYPEVLFDLSIAGLPDSFGSLKLLETRPNNLPTPSTTFVGREQQVQEVCALLRRADTRLLTLTGPGGTGKTRLAVAAAGSLLNDFRNGVFLVQLAPISDSSLLPSTIVQTLGIPEFASRSPLDSCKHYLAQCETLLVLDNFEQIVGAATVLLELLHACPKVKALVTSREALNVRLEQEYLVTPLQVPDQAANVDLDSLAEIESVRLFVDRARNHDPRFSLSATNAAAVAAICARLDGLPLALELAAAQLRLFTPQALAQHLQRSMELLAGGPRDLPTHQRTLRDTIAWSYRLLNDGEQLLFRRLSVFTGGSTIDSALAVGGNGQTRAEVLDTLMCLARKSLLTQNLVAGEIRLGMLQTIQEFGRQLLDETDASAAVHKLHADHYLTVAEKMAPGVLGSDQKRFVTALLAEQDNLRAALAWAIHHEDAEMTSRLVRALLWLWIPRGQFAEGNTWTKRALDRFAPMGPVRELALLLDAAGWLAALGGDYPTALPLFEQAYQIFHALPDSKEQARAKTTLSVTCLVLEDPRGTELSDQAVAMFLSTDSQGDLGLALLSAGIKHQLSGNAALAAECYEKALETFHRIDNVFWPGQILQNLAQLRLQEGDWPRAAALAVEAFEIGREYNYPMITSLSLAVLGAIAVATGAPTLAAQFFGAVDKSLCALGVKFEPPEDAVLQMNIHRAKTLLGPQHFDPAFAEGRCWREADIVAAVQSLRLALAV
jgi:predicted ATPase/class 3 adenylate cyclase